MHDGLGLLCESTRQASFTGFEFVDPFGTKRKGVPLLYAICKDLGEASSISGVRSNCCDSCLVPRLDLNQLRPVLAGTHPTRTEAAMAPRIQEVLAMKAEGAPQIRITEKCQEYQLHPVEVSATYFQ